MCFASRVLIAFTSAATVVVFPDPVAPPTSTRPCGKRVSCSTCAGSPNVGRFGGLVGSARMVTAARPRSR